MRFKKGSKVEVLSKKDVPSGSWRCAEILCGNGHNYTIRYAGTGDEMVLERISRKAIRPCPPLSEDAKSWAPGDVIEVFNDFSWKMASISKVLAAKYYMVRLLGSSLEFKVSKSEIRARQSWQDDKWVVIGKGSVSCEDGKHDQNFVLKSNENSRNHVQMTNMKINLQVKDDGFRVMNKEKFPESNIASSKTLKRGPYGFSQVEGYVGAAQKFRAIEKEGRLHRVFVANQYPLPKQVDPVTLPREMTGEKLLNSSFNNRTGFSETDAERREPTGAVGCSFALDLESHDADSVTCSVGSCSITSNNSYKLHHHVGFIEGNCSDAESFCQREYEEGNSLLPTKEELDAEIHRLELQAYRCTLELLHASGPLSWEQETLVTNLRLSLHISNDEHLMEGQSRRLIYLSTKCQKMMLEFAMFSGPESWANQRTRYDELRILAIYVIACNCPFQATWAR